MVVSSMFGYSCTDLNVELTDSKLVTTSAGGTTNADPALLLETAYKDLGAYTDQANIYALGEHTAGELIPPTRGVDWGDNGVWRVLDQHTWDGSNSWIVGSWNQLNQRVYKVGQILAANPSAAQAAEAVALLWWRVQAGYSARQNHLVAAWEKFKAAGYGRRGGCWTSCTCCGCCGYCGCCAATRGGQAHRRLRELKNCFLVWRRAHG